MRALSIRIETGVEIPSHKNRGRKRDPLPFDKLDVGQDFVMEKITKREFGSVRQKAQYQQRTTGKKFSCLFFSDLAQGKVWRLS